MRIFGFVAYAHIKKDKLVVRIGKCCF